MAVRPVDPPAFDAKAANDAWLKRVTKEGGGPFTVFSSGGFHALNRWLLGIGEYDGKGLFDAVKTNAQDLNEHKQADNLRHTAVTQELLDHETRLSRLESATGPLGSRFG